MPTNKANYTDNNRSVKSANYLELTCVKCGGSLNLDLDNLQSFCPYCGSKLMIDTNQLSDILSEREETKRYQMQLEHKERKAEQERKESSKAAIFCLVVFLLWVGFVGSLIFYGDSDVRDAKKQQKNLEKIVQEIKKDMNKKDYDTALYKANQLYYTPYIDTEEEQQIKEKWDKIRESTIKMIEEAKTRDNATSTTNTAVIFKGGGLVFSH